VTPCTERPYRTWTAARMALYREQELAGLRRRHRGLIRYCGPCFSFHITSPAVARRSR
jgi:hypothetical protein